MTTPSIETDPLQDFFTQGRQQALREAEEAAPRMRMAVEEALKAQSLAGTRTWAWALGGVIAAVAVAGGVAWVAVGSAQMSAWFAPVGAWFAHIGTWFAPVGDAFASLGTWMAGAGAWMSGLGTAFAGLGTWVAQAVHNAGLHLQPLRDWMQALPFVSEPGLRYVLFLAVGTAILVGLDAALRRSLRKPGTSA